MQGRRVFSKGCKEVAHRIAKASLEYDIPLENFGKLFLHMAVRFYMVMMRILLLLFLRETEKC